MEADGSEYSTAVAQDSRLELSSNRESTGHLQSTITAVIKGTKNGVRTALKNGTKVYSACPFISLKTIDTRGA